MDRNEYRQQIVKTIEDAKSQIDQWKSGKIFGVEELGGRWQDYKPEAIKNLEQIVAYWEKILRIVDGLEKRRSKQ